MEHFKKSLKIRIALLALLALAAGTLMVFSLSGGGRGLPDFLRGYQLGFASALTGAAVFLVFWYGWMLQNPERLRLQYNKENDERMKAIQAKAGFPMLYITSVLMLLAGMAGAYWRPIVFYVLVLAGTLQLFASIMVIIVYSKRM